MIALPVELRVPAVRVSALVLGAALLRAALQPFGDGLSTAVFALCLAGVAWGWRQEDAFGRWGTGTSLIAGLGLGAILVAPLLGGALSDRPLQAFWQWGAIAALIASLEEIAIRGRLQQEWTQAGGPIAGVLMGALVFALIHLPHYGPGAMPLDFAVGVALGGLRALTGRVLPGAIAHVMADWGAWFWA